MTRRRPTEGDLVEVLSIRPEYIFASYIRPLYGVMCGCDVVKLIAPRHRSSSYQKLSDHVWHVAPSEVQVVGMDEVPEHILVSHAVYRLVGDFV